MAYIFFILGIVMASTGITLLRDDGDQFFIFLGCVVLPTFGFAFWLAIERIGDSIVKSSRRRQATAWRRNRNGPPREFAEWK